MNKYISFAFTRNYELKMYKIIRAIKPFKIMSFITNKN